jgi:hypothetical protein
MQLKRADSKRGEWVTFALAAMAALLAVSTLAKVANLRAQGPVLPEGIAQADGAEDPNVVQERLAGARKVADQLKEKNLFVKKPPKENPVKQVEGILGHEALIGGKWYKAGEKVGDAKIIEVAATRVKVEWEGKETTFAPMAAAGSEPPAPPRPPEKPKKDDHPSPPTPSSQVEVVKVEPAAPVPEDPFAWLGVELSARARAKLTEFWNKMSDEEKEKAKKEWGNMSDEQKQQAVSQIESQM